MYVIVWKYLINPENREKFEHEYGPEGTWSKLFSQSENYEGSVLYAGDEEMNTYLLIDKWKDKQPYEEFLKTNKPAYSQLSKKCEELYSSEEKIGTYNEIT